MTNPSKKHESVEKLADEFESNFKYAGKNVWNIPKESFKAGHEAAIKQVLELLRSDDLEIGPYRIRLCDWVEEKLK